MMMDTVFYRLMLRDGGSVIVDAAQACRLIAQGKVISARAIGKEHVLYQRRLQPLGGINYLTK